jgi:hypothetical protein
MGSGAAADGRSVGPDGDHATIQAAVDAASPGDRITVVPGTYHEQVVVTTDDLTLVGAPGGDDPGPGADAPVLDGSRVTRRGGGFGLRGTTGVTVRGFEIRNFTQTPFAGGVMGGRSGVTVADCHVHTVRNSGVSRPGLGVVDPNDFTVVRNRIEDVGLVGIRLDNVGDSVVRNNVVRGTASPTVGDGPSKAGVWLHANVGRPDGGDAYRVDDAGTTVADNDVRGPFESGNVYVLVINRDDPAETPGSSVRLDDLSITGNVLRGNELRDEAGFGIRLGVNSVRGAPATLGDVSVTGNEVRGNDGGLLVGRQADAGRVAVHENAFVGNELAGVANLDADATLPAERNYWGAPDGPTRPVPGRGTDRTVGRGDRVYGDVAVRPWRPRP